MPKPGKTKYEQQREPVHPPVVTLHSLRTAVGLTLDQLADRIAEHLGSKPTKGALSAIEHGLRGASSEMLHAIALAYGIPPDAIDTAYVPRASAKEDAA